MVIMNAEDEDLQRNEERMAARKAQRKAQKKRAHTSEKVNAEGVVDGGEGKGKKKIKKEECEGPSKTTDKGSAEDPAYKKSKDSYSVAKDPKATEVFKSLFTSHRSASEQTRAHWITYNPFYN